MSSFFVLFGIAAAIIVFVAIFLATHWVADERNAPMESELLFILSGALAGTLLFTLGIYLGLQFELSWGKEIAVWFVLSVVSISLGYLLSRTRFFIDAFGKE
jgi:uncharacterized membrane protein SirB2